MKKYLILFTILTGLFSMTSCDDFLDVNKDPNNPVEVTPDLVLPVGLNFTARLQGEDRGVNHLGNMIMFNYGEAYGFSWYDEEFKYLVTSTFYDGIFDDTYEDCLKQYANLEGLGEGYIAYGAIAKIMKAYHFQMLVDLYGNVPYSEALLRGGNPTPSYDDAETIYQDLMAQLILAIEELTAAEESAVEILPDIDDIVFGGDLTAWKQFANSLKLRLVTRAQSTFDAATILAEIDAEGSGFITSDVGITPGYLQEEDKQNYQWDELGSDFSGNATLSFQATCATQYVLDLLTTTNDPRISFIYEEPESGHLGVNQGDDNNDQSLSQDKVSNAGPGILKGFDMAQIIMTLAEVKFNLAELALVAGDESAAAEYYNEGVKASFDYLGAGDASGYLSQGLQNVTFLASTEKLDAIMTQKWIALNGIDAIQSWFDYSRTSHPDALPISSTASTADRPVRLAYPSSEVTGNISNLPDQPNEFTAKIFWAN
ncbi:MAG: SusD/RagB family nutrient-binding outer membrane lipoprotein [Salinivirgaceae bacterium]|jgi:hypothetical protein|nr:SusD/RagB family nutrient-binding outer membrane lipoprotein [Salinivirgaceae bacterium]